MPLSLKRGGAGASKYLCSCFFACEPTCVLISWHRRFCLSEARSTANQSWGAASKTIPWSSSSGQVWLQRTPQTLKKTPLLLKRFQGPPTLMLLQKYSVTNGRSIVIQIGGVYATFCQEEGIHLQKYRDRNGRCITTLFKNIGVRGRFDSPDA